MKLTKILASMMMMMGVLLLPATDIAAQTRKGTARKTTTHKTTTKKATPAAQAVSLDGNYYEGILKLNGQPMDMFSSMTFGTNDMTFDFAGAIDLPASYTASNIAGKMNVNLTSDRFNANLTSSDKGNSLQGKIILNGNTFQGWLLKVNPEHTAPSLSDSELENIVGNPDGYTVFVIGEQNGQKVCIPADLTLKNTDKTFTTSFDNPTIQRIFDNSSGKYSVEDGKIVLTDSKGITVKGDVYDDGTYITIPIGSVQGFNFSWLLIR